MGGNAFGSVSSIDVDTLREEYRRIVIFLEGHGFSNVNAIGSTFKKDVMSDVDVVAEFDGTRDDAYAELLKDMSEDQLRRIGSNIVSIAWQRADEKWVQVDIVVGNVDLVKWTRFGPFDSNFKGTMRQVFLSAILTAMSERDFGKEWTDDHRMKYVLDLDNGMFKVVQTKRGVRGGMLRKWKTIKRELVSRSPRDIVRIVFHGGVMPEDVLSFESAVYESKKSAQLRPIETRIVEIFCEDVDEIAKKQPLRIARTRNDALAQAFVAKQLLKDSIMKKPSSVGGSQ